MTAVNTNRIKTILIVDDDQECRDLATAALGSDYSIQVATNGEDALKIAADIRPDLIVLDVMMPGGIDGFTTLCRLKENAVTANAAIVMLSEINTIMHASFSKETIEEYLQQSPSIFLEKPVSAKVLVDTVKQLLDS